MDKSLHTSVLRYAIGCILGVLIFGDAFAKDAFGSPAELGKSMAQVALLQAKISNRQITSVEVLWMDPSSGSRITVLPDTLDDQYFRRIEIRRFHGDRIEKTMLKAVSQIKLSRVDLTAEGDVRWAIKFFERGHKSAVTAIYLDGEGRTGYIDGVAVSFNSSLKHWLDEEFGNIFAGRGEEKALR